MKSPRHIGQLAAADDLPELVLELLVRLCREDGLSTNRIVSPTAPPGLSTTGEGSEHTPVDKSGVPTTTAVRDTEIDDGGKP